MQEAESHGASASSPEKAPFRDGMRGGSCLGPELLSQLAGLSLDSAELERNHPPPALLPSAAQVYQLHLKQF